jgi:hypothetical protein
VEDKMLNTIKLLLNKADDDSADELLLTLITLCKNEAYNYCNLSKYNEALDYIVIQMVIEKYNRMGSEGATAQTSSGIAFTYDSFYSDKVRLMLNKHRKVKMV